MSQRNPVREAAEIELACAVAHAAQPDSVATRKRVASSLRATVTVHEVATLLIVATYRQLRLARRIATLLNTDVEQVLAGDLDQAQENGGELLMLRLARMPSEDFDSGEAFKDLLNVFPIRPDDPETKSNTTEGEATT